MMFAALATATVADTTAYMFSSLLYIPDPANRCFRYQEMAFRIIVEKGSRDDQITTTWFSDGALGLCKGVSTLGALANAGGDLATGTCHLNFKVLSGSILGAAPASSSTQCSPGTYTVRHPAGAKSCIACTSGYAVASDGKSCSKCTGSSYTDFWGSAKCLPCERPDYGNTYCYSRH
jgi:hypothetical protein